MSLSINELGSYGKGLSRHGVSSGNIFQIYLQVNLISQIPTAKVVKEASKEAQPRGRKNPKTWSSSKQEAGAAPFPASGRSPTVETPPNWAATPTGNPEAARRPHTPAANAQAPRSRERGPGLRPGPSPGRAAPASRLQPLDREPRGGSARTAAPPPHPQGRPWPCPRPGPKGSSSRCSAEGSAGCSGDRGPSRQAPGGRGGRCTHPAPRAGRGRCSLLRAQGHRRHSPETPREAAAAAAPEPQERERRAAASARSRTER